MQDSSSSNGAPRRAVLKGIGATAAALTLRPALVFAQNGDYPAIVVMADERAYALQPDLLLIHWLEEAGPTDVRLQELGLERVRDDEGDLPVVVSDTLLVVRLLAVPAGGLAAFASNLVTPPLDLEIGAALPLYFASEEGLQSAISPIPSVFLIKFRDPEIDASDAGNFRTNELEYDPAGSIFLSPWHLFYELGTGAAVRESDTGLVGEPSRTFELVGSIAGDAAIEQVTMDWLTLFAFEAMPDDEILTGHSPWNLSRIRASEAWDVQNTWDDPDATDAMIIAVIDNGFDLGFPNPDDGHPDLRFTAINKHFDGRQAFTPGHSGPFDARYKAQLNPALAGLEAHGTLVAGIAAARVYNTLGVAGVAGGCPILPARIAAQGVGTSAATNKYIQAALRWSRLNGARVINISWHCGATPGVVYEIAEAVKAGIVICAAAGNQGTHSLSGQATELPTLPVKYPASSPACIAVGASDALDQRKRQASEDQQRWASHWGAPLDVVAPGVLIWSTDIQGELGASAKNSAFGVTYPPPSPPPWDPEAAPHYSRLMMGTSAASPHVAGLAALVMMKLDDNNYIGALDLPARALEVRRIIERTCDKVNPGMYLYQVASTLHPNGTWNAQVGYGRINAYRALQAAHSWPPPPPPPAPPPPPPAP